MKINLHEKIERLNKWHEPPTGATREVVYEALKELLRICDYSNDVSGMASLSQIITEMHRLTANYYVDPAVVGKLLGCVKTHIVILLLAGDSSSDG